ncbi:MAG: hypothetical protein D3926_13180 [Desulfobacteraceae bacterium]|nr:MAG: hypothetical protein D3926_13180 [Desulfobacteraceae bacterium]
MVMPLFIHPGACRRKGEYLPSSRRSYILYPQQWAMNELDEALQLVPGDVVMTPDGPSEFYFVTGESISGTGIFRAEDPRVITYVDQQVRSALPGLHLQDHKKGVDLLGTQGVVLTWEGLNNAGKPIEGRAYIVVTKGFALSLSGVSLKGLISRRTPSLEKIFTSFVIGQGQIDPALTGTWHKHATASLANPDRIYETAWSAAQSVSEEKAQLTFYPDGQWHRINTSHMVVGAGGVWLEDKGKDEYRGRWNADGKKLFMLYQDNTWEEFFYKIVMTDSGLELRTSVGKMAVIWRR